MLMKLAGICVSGAKEISYKKLRDVLGYEVQQANKGIGCGDKRSWSIGSTAGSWGF
jgi:hypothetical protein